MPTIEHSILTATELHEPKGVDSAEVGRVYISNGAGSGSWQPLPTGWGYYKDGGASQVIGTTSVKLSNDGAGSTTDTASLPLEIRSSGDLWDTVNDVIDPIRSGDAYSVRLALPITAKGGSPTVLTLKLDIGGAATPTIVIYERDISVSQTPPFTSAVDFTIFTRNTFVTNKGQLFLSTDSGTVTVTNPEILITKHHDGSI